MRLPMFISVTFLDRVTCLPHNVTKVDVIPGELGSPRFQSPCRGLGLLPEKQLAMLSVFVSSRLGRKGGVAAEQRGDGRGGGPDGPGEVCWQLPDADCWEGGDWYQLWAERWPGSHET